MTQRTGAGLVERLRAVATAPSPATMLLGWCTLGSTFAAETVGRCGADAVCVDMEHGLSGWDAALATVSTLSAGGIPVLVRVGSHDPGPMMKALDAGADGVVVPHVDSAEQAAAAVDACRYPPAGHRSWGPTRASLLYDGDTGHANDRVVCIPMLESTAAVGAAADIAATAGVSGLLVGSNDLSLEMTTSHRSRAEARGSTEFRDLLSQVAVAATAAGIPAAAPASTPAEVALLKELGFRVLVLPSDAALLRDAVSRAVTASSPDAAGRPPLSAALAY